MHFPQDGTWARLTYRLLEALPYGGRLAGFRNYAEHLVRSKQGRNGQGYRVRRDFVEITEVPFTNLLPTTSIVELHDPYPSGIVEFGGWGIVEREVAVFPPAERDEIQVSFPEQSLVLSAGRFRVSRLARNRVEGSGTNRVQ